jgi:RND family efflux transporter MFP subunit
MRRILRLIVLLVILVVAVAGGYYFYSQYTVTQAVAAAAAAQRNIQYAQVTRGTLAATVSAVGSIVPVNTARVSFRSAGVLKDVNVKVGDLVKAGDVLARLDTVDLELALATSMTNLDNARIKYQQSSQGPTAEDQRIAKANLEKSATNLSKAQSDYDKVAWMTNVGVTPQAAALQTATLDYQIAQSNYAKATSGATALDLALLANNVKLSEIQLETAKRNLGNATLIAPIDGVVSTVAANPGEPMGSSAVMVNIINLQSLRVDASVDETDMVKLIIGQSVTVTLDSLTGLAMPGTVTAIAPNATSQSGVMTYLVQTTLGATDPRLRSGLTATANITVLRKDNVIVVPNRAIRVAKNVRSVLVLSDGVRVEKQVTVGMSNDQYTEITAGLSEGEQVIIVTTATNQPLAGGAFSASSMQSMGSPPAFVTGR